MKAPYFLCIYNYKGYIKSSPGKAKQPYVQLLHSLAMLGCLSQPWNTAFILSNDKQEENKCCCEAWGWKDTYPNLWYEHCSQLRQVCDWPNTKLS